MASLDITVAEAPPLSMLPDGAVRVRGTRVSLDSVVHAFDQGCTPEEIKSKYPTLQLADIYAVITFYLRHRDEVHDYLKEGRQKAEEVRRKVEEICPPDGFRERLLARRERAQTQKS
jgi:uncharacterized protein (DUF433 family)